MRTVITITKDNSDEVEGKKIFDSVKELLEDEPDIKITGAVLNSVRLDEPPS